MYAYQRASHRLAKAKYPELNQIWDIGWKTALLDAHETYMDTAYWEQLQYIGDTRIQMLVSYDGAGSSRAHLSHPRLASGTVRAAVRLQSGDDAAP